MIKINLATLKQSATAGAGGAASILKGKFGALDRFTVDIEAFKSLPFRKIVLCLIAGVIATWTIDSYKDTELKQKEAELSKLKREKDKLNSEITQMKAAEETMKTLESDEAQIRAKVDTIKKLIAGRNNPPKILSALSRSIPKDVWLSEFKIDNLQIAIKGFSLGFNQISDFMKNLSENTYFSELVLKSSQQEQNSEIASFDLMAKQK